MFNYYENGKIETLSARKVYRLYTIAVDDEQKANGTTFYSWLYEMEKMQILNRMQSIKQCKNRLEVFNLQPFIIPIGVCIHLVILSSVHPWVYLYHSHDTAQKPSNEPWGVAKTKKHVLFSTMGCIWYIYTLTQTTSPLDLLHTLPVHS